MGTACLKSYDSSYMQHCKLICANFMQAYYKDSLHTKCSHTPAEVHCTLHKLSLAAQEVKNNQGRSTMYSLVVSLGHSLRAVQKKKLEFSKNF